MFTKHTRGERGGGVGDTRDLSEILSLNLPVQWIFWHMNRSLSHGCLHCFCVKPKKKSGKDSITWQPIHPKGFSAGRKCPEAILMSGGPFRGREFVDGFLLRKSDEWFPLITIPAVNGCFHEVCS